MYSNIQGKLIDKIEPHNICNTGMHYDSTRSKRRVRYDWRKLNGQKVGKTIKIFQGELGLVRARGWLLAQGPELKSPREKNILVF